MSLFDKPAKTKILGLLVAERGRVLSKSEISWMADVSRYRVYEYSRFLAWISCNASFGFLEL